MKRMLFRGAQAFRLGRWPAGDRLTQGVGSVFTRQAEAQREETGVAQTLDSPSNWFKLQVLDDETGNPVSGVSMELRLPGSEPKKYTTDSQGKIQASDLGEGVADIVSMTDSEAYEVVSLD